MTKVSVVSQGGRITSLICEGHAGDAEAGGNIVCAAVSILTQNCVNALEAVAGVAPLTRVDEERALIDITLPPLSATQDHDAQVILRTTVLGLTDIANAYPALVKLTTLNGRNKP
jgi:hypothetical protein